MGASVPQLCGKISGSVSGHDFSRAVSCRKYVRLQPPGLDLSYRVPFSQRRRLSSTTHHQSEGIPFMKYRKLGRTGFEVSDVAYGLWGMSGWTGSDNTESLASLQLSVDL